MLSGDFRIEAGAPGRQRRCCTGGFTLFELLVTLVVAAVLLAIAVPGLSGFVNSSRLRASQSEFISALTLARSEATKRGSNVVLLAATPVAGAEFNGGWRVFADTNGNNEFDAGELLIREYPPLQGDVKFSSTGGVTFAAFTGRGFLSPATTINFQLCGKPGVKKGYSVRLEPIGIADVVEGESCI